MPTLKVQAPDGKFLSIPVDPSVDPKDYEGMINDALDHYSGSIPQTNQPQKESFIQHELGSAKDYSWNDVSGSIAKGGIELNKYLQNKASDLAEAGGKQSAEQGEDFNPTVIPASMLATASQAIVPQNRLGVQLTGLQALTPFLGAVARAVGATPALEEAGQSIASKLYQYTGIPATKAKLLSQNLGQDVGSIEALNNEYTGAANTLGISKMAETLPNDEGSGAFARAVSDYTGKHGARIVNDPMSASYQDLHNVVESVSAKLDAPWAYPGTENMRTLPEAQAKELYTLKSNAQFGMLAKAMHEIGNDVPGAADRLDAVENIIDTRHDLAVAQSQAKLNYIPSNLNGSQNALRPTMAMIGMGGAATTALSGHPLAAIPMAVAAASSSPAVMNSVILNARAGAYFLPYAPGVAGIANNAKLGPAVQSLVDNIQSGGNNAQ